MSKKNIVYLALIDQYAVRLAIKSDRNLILKVPVKATFKINGVIYILEKHSKNAIYFFVHDARH